MPDQSRFQAYWSSLSVEERWKEAQSRDISPMLKAQQEDFERRRKSGFGRKIDLVPAFVNAYRSMREESRHGDQDARGLARACMKSVETAARQRLSKKDFARFKEGIK